MADTFPPPPPKNAAWKGSAVSWTEGGRRLLQVDV